MKFKMMSVFYSLHRKDGALLDRFVHYGGLLSLVAMLAEDNRIIQSQCVELLIDTLAPLVQQPVASSARQGHLHHQVFVCLRSPSFWNNFSQIIAEPFEVFPKSHAHSIKVLASAVGWLRPEEGAAVLGPSAVDSSIFKESLQKFIEGEVFKQSFPDIRGVAEDLLQELDEGIVCRPDPLNSKAASDAYEMIFAPDADRRENAAHSWQSLRQLGNEAFKVGFVWPAEACYRLALSEAGEFVPAMEASMIESNRAMALLKAGHPADAALAAETALAKNGKNAKSAFRRATALLELASGGKSAARAAADAVTAAELAAKLEPTDANVAKLLVKARARADELGTPEDDLEAEGDALDAMD